MVDIRQSKEYARFMERLGWKVAQITDNSKQITIYAYLKKFPLIGSFIKILHIKPPIPFREIEKIAKKYRAFKIFIQPDEVVSNKTNKSNWPNKNNGYSLAKSSLAPTKTIFIDLKQKEQKLFNSFSPEKRRAVRKAIKNNIAAKESKDIESFIKLKNQQLWPFGFLLRKEIKAIWEVFSTTKKATLLLAYQNNLNNNRTQIHAAASFCVRKKNPPLAGIVLLFHDQVGYYWLASSTPEGKKLFAPSLLVWEALKISKKRGCKIFNFEGIEDERFKETKNWQGFSKFKKGFGGKEITYASPIQKLFWPTL